jgi:hypothetical protein
MNQNSVNRGDSFRSKNPIPEPGAIVRVQNGDIAHEGVWVLNFRDRGFIEHVLDVPWDDLEYHGWTVTILKPAPIELPQGIESVVRFDRYQQIRHDFSSRLTKNTLTGGVAVRTGVDGWQMAGDSRYFKNDEIKALTGLTVLYEPEACS